jgi:hypothetical protein
MSTTDEPTTAGSGGSEPEVAETADAAEITTTAAETVAVNEPAATGETPAIDYDTVLAVQLPEGPAFVDPDATPPVGFPIPAPRRSRRKLWLSLLAVVVAVALVAVGYTGIRFLIDNGTYHDGHAAYERADCAAAITQFDDVISSWRIIQVGGTVDRAESEKKECLAFQNAATRPDDPGVIAAFSAFVADRPKSPLTDAARQRVTDLFNLPDLTKVAGPTSCDIVDKLRSQQLIPAPVTPAFLAACGKAYLFSGKTSEALKVYIELFHDFAKDKVATDAETELRQETRWCIELDKFRNEPTLSARPDLLPGLLVTCIPQLTLDDDDAVALAQEFLKKYRGHHFTPDLLTAIAKRINASARDDKQSTDFGAITPDHSVGGDKAVLQIANDAPSILWIVVTGPEPAFEEIDACPTCTVADSNKPTLCNPASPSKTIVLTPGEYDFGMMSPTTAHSSGGYARWTLQAGKQYSACFGEHHAT